MSELFDTLVEMNRRPEPFSRYSTIDMWDDEHISRSMLHAHLDEGSDRASRSKCFMQRSVAWMKSYFSISPSTRIVDFGCGPGLYTSEWARMGAAVTGIDVSRRSIEYAMNAARENRLAIRYIRDNYLECPLSGRYDLITLIFCDYCALSPNQRQQLLRRWKSILKPNGNVLFDVSSLKYLDSVHESRTYAFEERGGFWSMGPYHVFLNVHRYEAEKLLLEHYTVVEPNRTRMYYNWLQCFSLETLKTELDNEGFAIRAYFGNVAGDALTEESLEIAVVVTQAT